MLSSRLLTAILSERMVRAVTAAALLMAVTGGIPLAQERSQHAQRPSHTRGIPGERPPWAWRYLLGSLGATRTN